MSHDLTQPEEIDLVLKELDKCNIKKSMQVMDKNPSAKATQKRWDMGYISPYRFTYMKDHGLDS